MLQIKDEHNDELFRRAAENYPLKTDSADWEALRAKLEAAPAVEEQPEAAPKRKKRRFLWLLLLLIPLTLFELKYSPIRNSISGNEQARNTGTAITPSRDKTTVTTGSGDPGINQYGNEHEKVNSDVQSAGTMQTKEVSSGDRDLSLSQSDLPTSNPANNKISDSKEEANVPGQKHKQQLKAKTNMKFRQGSTDEENDFAKNEKAKRTDASKQKVRMKTAAPSEDEGNAKKEEVVIPGKTVQPVNESNKITDTASLAVITADKEVEQKKEEEKTKDSADLKKITREEKNEKTKQDKSKTRTKHFYIGLLAGPDFSTIKLQSVKKAGLNFGFIAGYKINKRFAVETGIFKDKKYYGTDGKYFDSKQIYLPPNATIDHVDGVCNMLEVPLNVNYTFRPGRKSSWFSTVGFSSYFMQNESYVYDVYRWGYSYPYNAKYDKKSSHFFAVINVSAGFTRKLGKIADLRIEPFIKLPVNKIGTGNLPIQSAGVLVGFTKTIF